MWKLTLKLQLSLYLLLVCPAKGKLIEILKRSLLVDEIVFEIRN